MNFTNLEAVGRVRALGVARARRVNAGARRALALSACTNACCSVRYACGRFGRESIVQSSWAGGEGCPGFTPQLVGQSLPAAA